MNHFIGIDVGTGSARAGVFTDRGRLLAMAAHPIRIWKPETDYVEQSSEDIWSACCAAVRGALAHSGVLPGEIAGIGFDATCSLVVLDAADRPLSVSPSGARERNVIVWMDHRAIAQAEAINRTRHPVLRYVGGRVSPEMQTPKLLWLKKHLPATWKKAARFLDLPDFLTCRATGDDTRSLCTTVCKWTYRGHRGLDGAGWDESFFRAIGIEELARERFARIGQHIRPMGDPLGNGLCAKAAHELGLVPGTPVGVSLIDAHAGGLALLGARSGRQSITPALLNERLALIGGTSSCHMAVSPRPRFIRGIWGPYFSAMLPDVWLTEGGQSATGALVDHVITSHAQGAALAEEAAKAGKTVYELLNQRLAALADRNRTPLAELTRDFHLQPDHHGNRSPLADPTLRGGIAGLTLSATLDDLAIEYLAAIQSIAYGTRHIIEVMNRKGYAIRTLLVSGGGTKNPLFLREHADITGCRLMLLREPEAMLLGSAILGAVAAGRYGSTLEAAQAMSSVGDVILPKRGRTAQYHERKYRVFRRMQSDFLAYRRLMAAGESR